MKPLRVALLGATSHIARGIIVSFFGGEEYELLLYARSPERVRAFIAPFGARRFELFPLESFGERGCDVVINCIGIGDPARLKVEAATILFLTERWDNRVLEFLTRHPEALYVNFSSGAAYGSNFSRPVDGESESRFPLNALSSGDFYGIAKLNAEAKHRAAAQLNIVDLRVFGYFSRYMDMDGRFLLNEIISCIQAGRVLVTGRGNIVRDYVYREDLATLIQACMEKRELNDVFDVYSRSPVAKFELLDFYASRYGLTYQIDVTYDPLNVTGLKEQYYSRNTRAAIIGYKPRFTSLEAITLESDFILQEKLGVPAQLRSSHGNIGFI